MANELTIRTGVKLLGVDPKTDSMKALGVKDYKNVESKINNDKKTYKFDETQAVASIDAGQSRVLQSSGSNVPMTEGGVGYNNMNSSTGYDIKASDKNKMDNAKFLHKNMISTIGKQHAALMNSVSKANSILEKMNQFQITVQSNYYKTSLMNQATMVSELQQIKNALMIGFNINPQTGKKDENEKEEKTSIISKLFFKEGWSGFKSAFGDIKTGANVALGKKIKEMLPFSDLLEYAGSFDKSDIGGLVTAGIKMGAKSLIKDIVKTKGVKKFGSSVNYLLDPDMALKRDLSAREDNPLFSVIADVLGVETSDKQRINNYITPYKARQAQGERATFDMKAHEALTIVIPELLSRQLNASLGAAQSNRLSYNYDRHAFEFSSDSRDYVQKQSMTGDFRDAMDQLKKNTHVTIETDDDGNEWVEGGFLWSLKNTIKDNLGYYNKANKEFATKHIKMIEKLYKESPVLIKLINEGIANLLLNMKLSNTEDPFESEQKGMEAFHEFYAKLWTYKNTSGRLVALRRVKTSFLEVFVNAGFRVDDDTITNAANLFVDTINIVMSSEFGKTGLSELIKTATAEFTKEVIDEQNSHKSSTNVSIDLGPNEIQFNTMLDDLASSKMNRSGGGYVGALNKFIMNKDVMKSDYKDSEKDRAKYANRHWNDVWEMIIDKESGIQSYLEFRPVNAQSVGLGRDDQKAIITTRPVTRNNKPDLKIDVYLSKPGSDEKERSPIKTLYLRDLQAAFEGGVTSPIGEHVVAKLRKIGNEKFEKYSEYKKSSKNDDTLFSIDPTKAFSSSKNFTTLGTSTEGMNSAFEKTMYADREMDDKIKVYMLTKLSKAHRVLYEYKERALLETENESDPEVKKTKVKEYMKRGVEWVLKNFNGIDATEANRIVDEMLKEDGVLNPKNYRNRYKSDEKFRKEVRDAWDNTEGGTDYQAYGTAIGLKDALQSGDVYNALSKYIDQTTPNGKANKRFLDIATSIAANAGGYVAGDGLVMTGIKSIMANKIGDVLGIYKTLDALKDETYENTELTETEVELKKLEAKQDLLFKSMGTGLGSAGGAMVHSWMKRNLRMGGILGIVPNLVLSAVLPTITSKLLKGGAKLAGWIGTKLGLGDFIFGGNKDLKDQIEREKKEGTGRRFKDRNRYDSEDDKSETTKIIEDALSGKNTTEGSASGVSSNSRGYVPGQYTGNLLREIRDKTCSSEVMAKMMTLFYGEMNNNIQFKPNDFYHYQVKYQGKHGAHYEFFADVIHKMNPDADVSSGEVRSIDSHVVAVNSFLSNPGKSRRAVVALIQTDINTAGSNEKHYVLLIKNKYTQNRIAVYDSMYSEALQTNVDYTSVLAIADRLIYIDYGELPKSELKKERVQQLKDLISFNKGKFTNTNKTMGKYPQDTNTPHSIESGAPFSGVDQNGNMVSKSSLLDSLQYTTNDGEQYVAMLQAIKKSGNPQERAEAERLIKVYNSTIADNVKKEEDKSTGMFGKAMSWLTGLLPSGVGTAVSGLFSGGLSKLVGAGITSIIGPIVGTVVGAYVLYKLLMDGGIKNLFNMFTGEDNDPNSPNAGNTTGDKAQHGGRLGFGKQLFKQTMTSVIGHNLTNNVVEAGLKEGAQETSEVLLKEGLEKISKSSTFLGKVIAKISQWLGGKAGKLLAKNSEKVTKSFIAGLGEALQKGLTKVGKKVGGSNLKGLAGAAGAASGPVGWAVLGAVALGFVVNAARTGWQYAYKVWGAKDNSQLSWGMCATSAIVSTLLEAIQWIPDITFIKGMLLGVGAEIFREYITRFIYDILCGLFGWDTPSFENDGVEDPEGLKQKTDNGDKSKAPKNRLSEFDIVTSSFTKVDVNKYGGSYSTLLAAQQKFLEKGQAANLNGFNDVSGGSGVSGFNYTLGTNNAEETLPAFVSQQDFSSVMLGGISGVFNGCALACAKMIAEFYNKKIDDTQLIKLANKYILKNKNISTDIFSAIYGYKLSPLNWVHELSRNNTGMVVALVSVGEGNHFITIYKSGSKYYIGDPMQRTWEEASKDYLSKLVVKQVRGFDYTKGINNSPSASQLGGSGFFGWLSSGIKSVYNRLTGGSEGSTVTNTAASQSLESLLNKTEKVEQQMESREQAAASQPRATNSMSGIDAISSIKYGRDLGGFRVTQSSMSSEMKENTTPSAGADFGTVADTNQISSDYSVTAGGSAPWVEVALRELANPPKAPSVKDGWGERSSYDKDKLRILKYLATAASLKKGTEPINQGPGHWCASFTVYCLVEAGIKMVHPKGAWLQMAISPFKDNDHVAWLPASKPMVGAIVVYKYSAGAPASGHMGIVVAVNGDKMTVLSGNTTHPSNKNLRTVTAKEISVTGKWHKSWNPSGPTFFWPANAEVKEYKGAIKKGGDAGTDVSAAGVAKISKDNAKYIPMLYNAFTAAGFSKNQSLALMAQVYRENSFDPNMMFGTHIDPAKDKSGNSISNFGMLSMNRTRRAALEAYIKSKGIPITNSRLPLTQESLTAQAEFAMNELKTTHKSMGKNFLPFKDISYEDAYFPLGKYLGWAYSDATSNLVKKRHPNYSWRKQKARMDSGYNLILKTLGASGRSGNMDQSLIKKQASVLLSKLKSINEIKDIICGPYSLGALATGTGVSNVDQVVQLVQQWVKNKVLDSRGLTMTTLQRYIPFRILTESNQSDFSSVFSKITSAGDDTNVYMLNGTLGSTKHWIGIMRTGNGVIVFDSSSSNGVSNGMNKNMIVSSIYTIGIDELGLSIKNALISKVKEMAPGYTNKDVLVASNNNGAGAIATKDNYSIAGIKTGVPKEIENRALQEAMAKMISAVTSGNNDANNNAKSQLSVLNKMSGILTDISGNTKNMGGNVTNNNYNAAPSQNKLSSAKEVPEFMGRLKDKVNEWKKNPL